MYSLQDTVFLIKTFEINNVIIIVISNNFDELNAKRCRSRYGLPHIEFLLAVTIEPRLKIHH